MIGSAANSVSVFVRLLEVNNHHPGRLEDTGDNAWGRQEGRKKVRVEELVLRWPKTCFSTSIIIRGMMMQQRLRIAMVFDHPAPGFCSYYRSWTLNFVVKQCPIISIAVALLLLLLPQRRNKDLPTRNPAQLFLVLAVMGPATRWSRVKRSKTIMKQKSRRIASAKKVIPSFKWIFPLHSLKCNADASTKKKEKLAFKICSSNSSSFLTNGTAVLLFGS